MAKKQPPAAPKKTPPAAAADAALKVDEAAAAAASTAQTGAPDTPPATVSDPAPDTTQEHAGAGETQDEPILSGANGPDPVIGLRITAKREGFRRAGRAWSKQPTEIPLAGLSDADIAALKAETMLTVEEVVLP